MVHLDSRMMTNNIIDDITKKAVFRFQRVDDKRNVITL